MFDFINGEQVKCFPKAILRNNELFSIGGSFISYETGDAVPCKAPNFMYGDDYIILDICDFPYTSNAHDHIIHIIKNGIIKNTIYDEIYCVDFTDKTKVINSNGGELLNIKSCKDIMKFIIDYRKYQMEYMRLNSSRNLLLQEAFKKFVTAFEHRGLVNKRKNDLQSCEFILKLIDDEDEKLNPLLNDLDRKYIDKWRVDNCEEILELMTLGSYILASKEESSTAISIIKEMLGDDPLLYDRYVEWMGSDEYIKKFKMYIN